MVTGRKLHDKGELHLISFFFFVRLFLTFFSYFLLFSFSQCMYSLLSARLQNSEGREKMGGKVLFCCFIITCVL